MKLTFASTLASAVSLATIADGFANTYPIFAHSSTPLASLQRLSPQHPSHKLNVFRPSTQQPLGASESDDDLCTPSTLLLFHLPALHASDLSALTLPTTLGPKQSLVVPYVPLRGKSTAEKFVKTYIRDCSASVQSEGLASLWAGENHKTVRVEELKGLEKWTLTSKRGKEQRRKVIAHLEERIQSQLATVQGPYVLIVTTLPTASLPHLIPATAPSRHTKRQFEDVDEMAEETQLPTESPEGAVMPQEDDLPFDDEAAPASDLGVTPVASPASDLGVTPIIAAEEPSLDEVVTTPLASYEEALLNDYEVTPTASAMVQEPSEPPKSIFEIPPNSGLLHRYVFFTSPLIFALLVSLIILIPVLIFSSQALTSTQTVAGLEGKMTGTVGLDPAKA